MAEGCLADLTKQPCLSHNAKVRLRRLVGPAHVQAGHDVGIGRPPIPLQLPAAVRRLYILMCLQNLNSSVLCRRSALPLWRGAGIRMGKGAAPMSFSGKSRALKVPRAPYSSR